MDEDELKDGVGGLDGDDMDDDADDTTPGKKKNKKGADEELESDEPESIDDLADKEEDLLPEDSFDDVDMW